MSLPHVFGTTAETIPAVIPYLRADPALTEVWRARYAAQGRAGHRRVGIVFQANPSARNAAQRSLGLGDVARIARVAGIDLVNLQHGAPGRAVAASVGGMIEAMREPMGLDSYAAAIAATDLLISVDTLAAHCAGAMGPPVRVALPATPEWRWGRDATTTAWYPAARLFRQGPDRGWDDVVAALCSAG